MMFRRLSMILGLCSAMLLAGCASGQFAFDEPELRSILVVPVINETNSVEADTLMHATATTPLANMGYYAFPVDTVKFVLESESLYEPERVRELGPVKLAEMFHADSVLFIKVTYWDAQYIVLNTKTKVTAEYELFKADGTSLWKDTVTFAKDSSSQNASLLGRRRCRHQPCGSRLPPPGQERQCLRPSPLARRSSRPRGRRKDSAEAVMPSDSRQL